MSEHTAPRIYAACLASYNAGRLFGRWIDCEGKSGDELGQEIARMLKGSPCPNVQRVECTSCEHIQCYVPNDTCAECGGALSEPFASAEEWAIHDHEGFAGLIKSEWPDLEDVAAIAEGLHGNDRCGFLWLVADRGMKPSEALDQAESVCLYQADGVHDLASDYAQELASGTIENFEERASQWPFSCIDWEQAGRELVIGGDVELAEFYGERMLITNPNDF